MNPEEEYELAYTAALAALAALNSARSEPKSPSNAPSPARQIVWAHPARRARRTEVDTATRALNWRTRM